MRKMKSTRFPVSWEAGFLDSRTSGFPEFRVSISYFFFCFKRLTMILASGCFWNSSRICCIAQRIISCFEAFISNKRRSWIFISSRLSYSPSVMRNVSLMVGLSLILNKKSCCATCTGPVSRIPGKLVSRILGVPIVRVPGVPGSRSFSFPSLGVPLVLEVWASWEEEQRVVGLTYRCPDLSGP